MVGLYGERERNERRQILIEFVTRQNIIIINSFLRQNQAENGHGVAR